SGRLACLPAAATASRGNEAASPPGNNALTTKINLRSVTPAQDRPRPVNGHAEPARYAALLAHHAGRGPGCDLLYKGNEWRRQPPGRATSLSRKLREDLLDPKRVELLHSVLSG